jgi:hypothetical protein
MAALDECSSPEMQCVKLTQPVENPPADGWLILTGPSFRWLFVLPYSPGF